MTQAFFLTRQTAKLMEDFVREITAGAGLYLLYGDPGVGKTRTLQEMAGNRLGERRVHWIDLKAGGSGDGALVDSSVMIENIFAEAGAGDIIIADHFEMALKKTRHQLFLSSSTDGVDKQLNLIISGNTNYIDEMEQLAQQYQLHAQSFQQTPFNPDDAAAFLGFYLFPDRPIGQLSVPPLLRNQLSEAQGNIAGIIEVAERAGDQITSKPMDDTESIRKGSRVIVGALVAVALVAVGSWYFLNRHAQRDRQLVEIAPPVASMQTQNKAAEVAENPPLPEPQNPIEVAEPSTVSESAVAQDVASTALGPAAPAALLAVNADQALSTGQGDVEAIPQTAVPAEAETAIAVVAESEPELAVLAYADADPEPAVLAYAEAEPELQPQLGRLQRDLQTSMAWIDQTDRKVGTLQIMMLNEKRFDEPAFYEYIDQLEAEGVDPRAVRILRTLTAGQEVYSVVYGEYASWKAAGDAKDDLPAILKRNSPIPRSVGGLLDEMRRLEGQN